MLLWYCHMPCHETSNQPKTSKTFTSRLEQYHQQTTSYLSALLERRIRRRRYLYKLWKGRVHTYVDFFHLMKCTLVIFHTPLFRSNFTWNVSALIHFLIFCLHEGRFVFILYSFSSFRWSPSKSIWLTGVGVITKLAKHINVKHSFMALKQVAKLNGYHSPAVGRK